MEQNGGVLEPAAQLRTDTDAYLLLERLRWGSDGPQACPKCDAAGRQYFLNPKNGSSRRTRTGRQSARRVWKCGHCRRQYSVLTATIFHGTRISMRTWLLVIFEFCASKNPVSAWRISRKYKVTNEAAWHMLHRIEQAVRCEPVATLTDGSVQVDEAWIGGEGRTTAPCGPRGIP